MLKPDYLYNVSDRAIELYEELNTWAVKDICRRLVNADWQFTGSIDWQLYKLQQSGMHMDEIVKKVARLTKKSQKEIADIFEEAAYKSQSYDNEVYRQAGLTPIDIKQSPQMLKILQATYEQTMGEIRNFTRSTANASQSIFLKTMDDVYFRVMSGQQSYSEAVRQAINELSSTGIVISYPTGHTDTIETAVRRCVMTGVGQATARVSMQNAKELDTDLVLVSAHLGARPSHAEWQGKVYSISGNSKKYPKLSETTGYGTVTGLCGANCRHHFMPYIDGVSGNPYETFDSKENEEYYNNQQTQRKKERGIRTTKRELQALETSIDATKDEKLKFALQQDYDRKAAKLKAQMADYRAFSRKVELPMQNERLQIANSNRRTQAGAKAEKVAYFNSQESECVREDAQNMNPKNKYGEQIQFDWKGKDEKHVKQQQMISMLSNEYNTRLQKVTVGAERAAGDVQISGAIMRLNHNTENVTIHEFAHTLANSSADKYGLTNDVDFWKEIKKIRREYHKDVDKNSDTSRWISQYEHSSKSVDEFFAEAFTQAKMHELGLELPSKYGSDLTYSKKVLEVVDNYFKKTPLENVGESGTIKLSNIEVRKKYIDSVSKIKAGIDKSLPIEEQAKQAFEARNRLRAEARKMMADEETRKKLDVEKPNKTFEELVRSKMERKGMTREEAIQDVYDTATKTNSDVNKELGLGGD